MIEVSHRPVRVTVSKESRRKLRNSWMLDKPEALGLAVAYALNGLFGLIEPFVPGSPLSISPYPWPVSLFLLFAGMLVISGMWSLRQRLEMWGLTLMGLAIAPIAATYIAQGDPPGRIAVVTAIIGGLIARAARTWYLRHRSRA